MAGCHMAPERRSLMSYDGGQLRDRFGDATCRRHVDTEFVVSPADVLDEGVAGHDHRGRPASLQTSHRPQAGLEPTMVGLDPVVGVVPDLVEGTREELVHHADIAR